MRKIDFRKELNTLYLPPSKEVVQVDVPTMNFLMIDGEGDPNTSQAYAEAVEALFTVSYAAKFATKKGSLAIDYGVMPLEGLWWADDLSAFAAADKAKWKWTMMIMQPRLVTPEAIDQAIARSQKKASVAALSKLRLEPFAEGRCAQTLHIGPFSEEGPTIERVHRFIAARGERTGKHHEIYLSDIRRAEPSKWRTVIRQPMR